MVGMKRGQPPGLTVLSLRVHLALEYLGVGTSVIWPLREGQTLGEASEGWVGCAPTEPRIPDAFPSSPILHPVPSPKICWVSLR